ncbi:MAG: hypothetical protein AB7P04_03800 [Bacteriovoracia bacterium]
MTLFNRAIVLLSLLFASACGVVPVATSPVLTSADQTALQALENSVQQKQPIMFQLSPEGDGEVVTVPRNGDEAYADAYTNGDLYFLIGHLADDWTKDEWTKFYSVAKWSVQRRFRVILNPVTFVLDLKEAVQNERASVIIWSSHADTSGTIYDAAKRPVPTNIFYEKAGRAKRHYTFSNCYSDLTVNTYSFPVGTQMTHWTGTTTSGQLFAYLFSDRWNRALEETLGIKF